MAQLVVKGMYRRGRVDLDELPGGVADEVPVHVVFDLPSRSESSLAVVPSPEDEEREALRREAFAQMERGIPLGGPPYPKRDELYDRFER